MLLVLCLLTSVCFAQKTYYIASNGNDANDGQSAENHCKP